MLQAAPRPGSGLFPLRAREIAKDAIPGYEILREIHRGGQGVVYQAIQKSTQRKVAIKVVHGGPFAGERERARVEREVRILAGLDHPCIVKIHDSGVAGGISDGGAAGGGSFYYVMDYVSGQSLDAFITKEPKPIEEVLRLFGQICEAVSAAHLKGVIHRDLKPGNIRIDGSGRPHILDFGLAKLSTPEQSEPGKPRIMTMTGQFVGSLPWASPEQATGAPDRIDVRTDVYSLGVILYQLLTGRFPYQVVGHMREVLDHILKTEPARPSTVRRQINDEVETIVLKCLAKEPERRYQSAGELARDIQHYLRGEPIQAKRDSGWYVITKTLRRHRAAVAVGAGFLVLVTVFGLAMGVMWLRERALKGEVQRQLDAVTAEREAKEAARARAQANFESVRELAHVFMYDFADGIEDLRGATRVREKLLTTAKGALVKLMAAEPSAELDRELADAYDRVGDIEAGLYLPRVGATATGAEHYAKARAIRERLLGGEPQSPQAHADLGESLRRSAKVLQRGRKFGEARQEFARAIGEYDSAIALAGGAGGGGGGGGGGDAARRAALRERRSAIVRETANLLVTSSAEGGRSLAEVGQLIGEALARYAEVEVLWRERLHADPADRKAREGLGVVTDQRARALIAHARAFSDASRKAAGNAAGADPEALRLHREGLARLGEAREATRQSEAEFRKLSTSHPQDGAARRDLLIALYNVGDTWMREGEALDRAREGRLVDAVEAEGAARLAKVTARGLFEESLAIARELVRADEGNLECRRDAALVLNKLGNVLRDLGEVDGAGAVFQESLELREDLWRTDPMQQHRFDLAVGLYKRAETERLRAKGEGLEPAERTRRLEAARGWYARCLDAYGALKEAGVEVRDRDIARVRSELEECEAALRTGGGR